MEESGCRLVFPFCCFFFLFYITDGDDKVPRIHATVSYPRDGSNRIEKDDFILLQKYVAPILPEPFAYIK